MRVVNSIIQFLGKIIIFICLVPILFLIGLIFWDGKEEAQHNISKYPPYKY